MLPAAAPPRRELAALAESLHLAHGRRVALRALLPQDADALQAFVAALAPASRRARFHGTVNRLPAYALEALTVLDFEHHVALVAEAGDRGGAAARPHLVGEARFVREAPGEAEFALAVADAWRGTGLGRAILGALARHARARGIVRLRGTVQVGNAPMLALARRLGGTVRSDARDAPIVRVRLDLAGATADAAAAADGPPPAPRTMGA